MSILQTALVIYIALLSVIGFAVAGVDKRRARRGAWRVPEKAFLLLSALGGGLGVLAGFLVFRHKTKHAALMFGVLGLTALWIAGAWVAYGAVCQFSWAELISSKKYPGS